MKKKKEKKPEFVVGKKIKEIKVDKAQHITELSFAVSIFAVILLCGLICLALMFNNWFVWLLCGILLVYFLTHSVMLVVRASTHPKYILCENCLVVNSIWHYGIIKLNTITKMETKSTIFDGRQQKHMASIVIHFNENGKNKMTLHSITDDLSKTLKDIDAQVKIYRKNIEIKNEKSE